MSNQQRIGQFIVNEIQKVYPTLDEVRNQNPNTNVSMHEYAYQRAWFTEQRLYQMSDAELNAILKRKDK